MTQDCPLGCPASYTATAVVQQVVKGGDWACPGCGGPVAVCADCEAVVDTVAAYYDNACPNCNTPRHQMTTPLDERDDVDIPDAETGLEVPADD